MSDIKSYSVGNGDMFYIQHNTDNFTIIDCSIGDDNADRIIADIIERKKGKNIVRFISTHPDEDHIMGLERLDNKIDIVNFYCVRNKVTKKDVTDSFTRYCKLRDDTQKAFYIEKGCKRKWMNEKDETREQSGIHILWPNPNNAEFKAQLKCAEDGGSPNNISAVIQYSVGDGATVVWMGDLETAFMESIEKELDLPKVDIVFAPHHGRDSGKIPEALLKKMSPKMIVIGEAPSQHLNYYQGYNTLTQNSAGDILFECVAGEVHVFTSNKYTVGFLANKGKTRAGYYYVGTLAVGTT